MANLKQPLSQNIITVLGPDLVSLLDYDFESGTLLRVKFQYATRLSTFASSLCQFPLCLLPPDADSGPGGRVEGKPKHTQHNICPR